MCSHTLNFAGMDAFISRRICRSQMLSEMRKLADSLERLDAVEYFAIGPLTSDELWKSGRDNMSLDRGS